MGSVTRASDHQVLPERAPTVDVASRPDSDLRAEAHLRAGSVAALRSLRAGLAHCLGTGGCGVDVIADAQLVLVEITTNAFIHDAAPLVQVHVSCTDHDVAIVTRHRGEVAPPPFPVRPVVGREVVPGGRGLMIVDRLVSSREVANDAGCTTTVVRIRRSVD